MKYIGNTLHLEAIRPESIEAIMMHDEKFNASNVAVKVPGTHCQAQDTRRKEVT